MSFVFKIAFLLVFGPAVCDNEPGDNKTAVEATTLVQNSNKTIVASWQPFTHRMLAEVRAVIAAKSSKLTAEFEKRSGTAAASQPPSFAKNSVSDNTHTDNKGVAGIAASNYPPFVENTMADSTVAYDKHIPGTAAATPPPSLVENRGAENKSETTENGIAAAKKRPADVDSSLADKTERKKHQQPNFITQMKMEATVDIITGYDEWQRNHQSVSMKDFSEWEKLAIGKMMSKHQQKNVALWPVTDQYALVDKQKVMLAIVSKYVFENFEQVNKNFVDEQREDLVQLLIRVLSFDDEQRKAYVKFGWDGEKKFKHIGIGMEGASNVNQVVGSKFQNGDVLDTFTIDNIDTIKKTWLEIAKEHIFAWKKAMGVDEKEATNIMNTHLNELKNVLEYVTNAIAKSELRNYAEHNVPNDLQFHFFKQKTSTQIVFTAADVYAATDAYYIRNNKGDETNFADAPKDLTKFYFAMPYDENKSLPGYSISGYRAGNIFSDNVPHLVKDV